MTSDVQFARKAQIDMQRTVELTVENQCTSAPVSSMLTQ